MAWLSYIRAPPPASHRQARHPAAKCTRIPSALDRNERREAQHMRTLVYFIWKETTERPSLLPGTPDNNMPETIAHTQHNCQGSQSLPSESTDRTAPAHGQHRTGPGAGELLRRKGKQAFHPHALEGPQARGCLGWAICTGKHYEQQGARINNRWQGTREPQRAARGLVHRSQEYVHRVGPGGGGGWEKGSLHSPTPQSPATCGHTIWVIAMVGPLWSSKRSMVLRLRIMCSP